MIFDRTDSTPGANFLFLLACFVIVVAGLKVGAPILLPFAVAVFLAILSLPLLLLLQKRGIPGWLGILLVVLVNVALFGLLIFLAAQSIDELQQRIPVYNQQVRQLLGGWVTELESRGIPAGSYVTTDSINPQAVLDFVGGTISRVASFLSNAVFVLIIMAFILSEAQVFPQKFRAVMGSDRPETDPSRFAKVTQEVQEYLGIKTVVSLTTGLLIGFWTWWVGLDFPVLLGLLGFVLNYIPTLGSVLASIPAVALGLIEFGIGRALIVGAGYLVINTIFGNIIEPNLLGRRLGLSTLVVILSLLFWGWLWGPIGALLSVPLTMVVKIWLENTKDLRWVALLLDKGPPAPASDDSTPLAEEVG